MVGVEDMIEPCGIVQARVSEVGIIAGIPGLRVCILSIADRTGSPAVGDLLHVAHVGEIVGVASMFGAGQRALVEALIGQRTPAASTVHISSKPTVLHPRRHAISTKRRSHPALGRADTRKLRTRSGICSRTGHARASQFRSL